MKSSHFHTIYEKFALLLGVDAALKIYNEFRGQMINFPTKLFSQEFVINQIVNDYDGENVKSLATKYGFSERWVREILKKHIEDSR